MRWRQLGGSLLAAGLAVLVGLLLLAMLGAAVLGVAAILGSIVTWLSG